MSESQELPNTPQMWLQVQIHQSRLQTPSLDIETCEDLSFTYNQIFYSPPGGQLHIITEPLNCETCPPEAKIIIRNLKKLAEIDLGLNVKDLLSNILKNTKPLNRYDLLMSTLMAINEFTSVDSSVKADVNNLIFYLLKRRYLGKYDFSTARNGFCETPVIFGKYPLPPDVASITKPNLCICQIEIIELLLAKLSYLENRKGFECANLMNPQRFGPNPNAPFTGPNGAFSGGPFGPFSPSVGPSAMFPGGPFGRPFPLPRPNVIIPGGRYPPRTPLGSDFMKGIIPNIPSFPNIPAIPNISSISNISTIERQMMTQVKTQEEQTKITERLTRLLPIPRYPKEKLMLDKLRQLLASPLIQDLIKNMNTTAFKSDAEMFDVLTKTVLHTVKTEEAEEVFKFFSNYKEVKQAQFNFGVLIDALPQARSPKEQRYFDIIKQLLMSKFLYQFKFSNRFTQASSLTDKLLVLCSELISSKSLSPEILEALLYCTPVLRGRQGNVHYDNLINLLPAPRTEADNQRFNLLRNLLTSDDIYVLMQNVSFTNVTENQRLTIVLHQLINNANSQSVLDAATYCRNALAIQRFGFNYFDLLNLVNGTDSNRIFLLDYFYSPECEMILSRLKVSALSDIDKLKVILEAINQSSSNTQVRQVCAVMLSNLQLQMFFANMRRIISIIPTPKNENEQRKYAIVTNYLMSQQAYLFLAQIDASVFPDYRHLLNFVMKAVADSNVDAAIKDAFEYYVDLNERLEAIEFITRKEIRKNFKLTEIFTDTLDLRSLTLPQKDAFKKFFKYVSEIKPNALSQFDSWDEAKTRGQFMRLLFKYLLEQPSTLPEIKQSILILNSLLRMDGKGALPP